MKKSTKILVFMIKYFRNKNKLNHNLKLINKNKIKLNKVFQKIQIN